MDFTRFFFVNHAPLHSKDLYEGRTPGIERWLGGLSDDQMRVRPGRG
jgi:hypothetical protein